MPPTSMIDNPKNGNLKLPVPCLHILSIQPNIFCPTTESSQITKYFVLLKYSCNLITVGPFESC